ncbi:hypothetical protein Xmau_00307 [Xenorhabdus mauleonii]|uniref:HNH endonuclease n=1 Tax=Xenorhabdus mauleonii TaxID=351675 RepID=A0A1I3U5Z4_9GAMM|nr:HNH endonuclease signature motif containing protein [Xenorhabdus mauleonii]PHM45916.1 hypothetical protein Xmau_00307 [Xenorhabdus mauleonii]SFJ78332.1 HNH endonuclease [Xenorhabdus mauleonii]
MKKALFFYSDEMKLWMKENYRLVRHQLTDAFNVQFNTNQSRESVCGLRKRLGLRVRQSATWEKGYKPIHTGTKGVLKATSGSFKAGHDAIGNKREVGAERINSCGYMEIKIANPSVWRLKHLVIWEEHHGERSKNHVITFKDGNPLNCQIDNLVLITRTENTIVNNTNRKLKAPAEFKSVLINLVKIEQVIASKSANNA